MNKILKILSILIIGFVMFSCSTPTNDPILYVPEPSSPETPEVQTYSITFTPAQSNHKIITDYLNSLPEFKNLKEGTEVKLYKHIYLNEACTEITTEIVETSVLDYLFKYDTNNPEVSLEYDSNSGSYSVVIGKEDVEVKLIYEEWSKLELRR